MSLCRLQERWEDVGFFMKRHPESQNIGSESDITNHHLFLLLKGKLKEADKIAIVQWSHWRLDRDLNTGLSLSLHSE